MLLPESWTERLPFLGAMEDDWQPVPRVALIAWLIFYAFVFYELISGGEFPKYMDLVFVPVHEGGHLLFAREINRHSLKLWAARSGAVCILERSDQRCGN